MQQQRDQRQFARDRAFEERRLYKGIAGGIATGITGTAGIIGGLASRVGRSAASGLGLNEATNVSGIIEERALVNGKLRAIGIESRGAGEGMNFDEQGARQKLQAAARQTGTSQAELVEALDVFSEKGKGAQGVENIGRVAGEAKAMGVSPAVVAKLRSQMLVSADATGQKLSEQDIEAAIARLAFVGKTGVFRAGAMAEQSEALFSRAAASGVDFRSEIGRYAAFANEARKSTGSGATARTSINSIQDALIKKESKIKALGVDVRDDQGNERDFIEVVQDLIVKTGGRGDAFNKIIDPSRSGKAIQTMLTAFNAAGGGEKGRSAMQGLLSAGEGQSGGMSNAQIVGEMNKDIDASLGGEGTKLKQGVEQVRQTIAEALEPALVKLAKVMPELVEKFQMLVDFVSKHPLLSTATVAGGLAAASVGSNVAREGGRAALKYLAGGLVNTVPGIGGAVLSGAANLASSAIGSAGAAPVFVTNWPNGMGGGNPPLPGGMPSATPAAGGASSAVAAALGPAAVLGAIVATAAVVTNAALTYTDSHEFRKNSMERHADATENEIAVSDLERIERENKKNHGAGKMAPKPLAGGAVVKDLRRNAGGDIMAAYGPGASKAGHPVVTAKADKYHLGANIIEKLAAASAALDELTKKARASSVAVSNIKSEPHY